ncbi:MAG: preprotein translocase subunit SecA [Phytoplasma sp.]|uniref:preprotein translocase subunit SecA n=1 Tax=Phytoplasma sp. TaxID=2155 RepID=UPI002B414B67|nr:preprotein translocase subunit SecA [Phytoplasma sp.]WRH06975.1 MAG: preprotein translocase subunit SecA [Phytoplasma sp.]
MFNFVKNFFNSSNKYLKKIKPLVNQIETFNNLFSKLNNEDFPKETERLKKLYNEGASLDDLLAEAFALAKEACKRVTGLDPYNVQMLGAIVLHKGQIAEMKTGEGKTLTSVMPAYLNALNGKGVHIVTVNEYLARRESEGEIGDIFRFLGMTVGLNIKEKNIEEKKLTYKCDIIYSTNSELGFDYLRDNIQTSVEDLLMTREYNYAIIDEVDSILIDEARTPLIISSPARQSTKFYRDANRFAKTLREDCYVIDLESNTIEMTEQGIQKAETFFQIKNLYNGSNYNLLHCIKNALKAFFLMKKNKDYLVDNNRILIIDQFTGRILRGRQFSEGLHQALEAKEGCHIEAETEISATITYQNFFRIYKKISGMTGTAKTEEKEFINIYNMRVIEIPTNKLMIRTDAPDFVFATLNDKWEALIEEIETRYKKKQPILIGTVTVAISEQISKQLKKRKILHEVLNAKNHLKEAEIIAKAGKKGSITIATNMAGRGTDIRLGEGVVELGGLAVLGTERHESRRIDNQLRGRAGRQGDPGFSRFFVSGEDDLVKRFGANKIQNIIMLLQKNKDKNGNNKNISFKFFTRFFTNMQKKIESSNFDYRKFILQFDSVLGLQREIIYQQRKEILITNKIEELALNMITKKVDEKVKYFLSNKMKKQEEQNLINFINYLEKLFFPKDTIKIEELKEKTENKNNFEKEIIQLVHDKIKNILTKHKENLIIDDKEYYTQTLKFIMLQNIDNHFKSHISDMHALSKSINFVSYGQQNVLKVYQDKGRIFFNEMIDKISYEITHMILKFSLTKEDLLEINKKPENNLQKNNLNRDTLNRKKRRTKNKIVKNPWN